MDSEEINTHLITFHSESASGVRKGVHATFVFFIDSGKVFDSVELNAVGKPFQK